MAALGAASPWYALLRAEHELFARNLRELVADPELGAPTRRKLAFLAEQAVAATAPENWPWSNPAVLRAALDTVQYRRRAAATCWSPDASAASPGMMEA